MTKRCHWIIDRGNDAVGKTPESVPLCATHLGIALSSDVCTSSENPDRISRHGKWKSKHRPPRCRICGEEL